MSESLFLGELTISFTVHIQLFCPVKKKKTFGSKIATTTKKAHAQIKENIMR